MEKTGDIFLTTEKKRCLAWWRPVDGSRDVFLCAMDWDTYSTHPHLRKMFVELATEAMLNRGREAPRASSSAIIKVAPREICDIVDVLNALKRSRTD